MRYSKTKVCLKVKSISSLQKDTSTHYLWREAQQKAQIIRSSRQAFSSNTNWISLLRSSFIERSLYVYIYWWIIWYGIMGYRYWQCLSWSKDNRKGMQLSRTRVWWIRRTLADHWQGIIWFETQWYVIWTAITRMPPRARFSAVISRSEYLHGKMGHSWNLSLL